MSHFDTAHNVVHARIVYWGPAGSGKTATLRTLRGLLDPTGKARLYSIAAADRSTLTFDLLPIQQFRCGTVRVRLQALACPGVESRSHARLALLKEADAIVFVADARRSEQEANLASWRELQGTLRSLNVDPATIPTVWSFNKRDMVESAPASELRTQLGVAHLPTFDTIASDGEGVVESFTAVFRRLMDVLAEKHALPEISGDSALPTRVLANLTGARTGAPKPAAADRHLIVETGGSILSPAEQAIQAQIGLVRAHVEADALIGRLEERNRELVAVNRVARSILSAMETDNLLVVLLDSTAEYIDASHVTCVLFDPTEEGALRTHVRGFGRDPALGLRGEGARRFFELLKNSDGPVPLQKEHNPDLLAAIQRVDRRIKRVMYQPIKGDHDKPAGWIGIYHTGAEPRVSTQGLLFLSSVSRLAALGLHKIALVERLLKQERRHEARLRQRTGELEMANAKVRALNRGLESRVKERVRALEESNRKLREEQARAVHAARVHGMGEVATSFLHEILEPVEDLRPRLAAMRDGLDELRARVGAAAGSDVVSVIADFESILEQAEKGSNRVNNIVRSLKRFSGQPGGQQGFNLNTLVAEAAALLEERIRRRADLELSLGTVPDQEGDGAELGHAIHGLLTNSIEAIERGDREQGSIYVTTFAAGEKLTLIVKDDGCGIDDDVMSHIFEPFLSTKKEEPGAGLGLHATYKTVKGLGGDIRVRSKPGEGTTVTITLPLAQPARRQQELKADS